MLCLFGIFAEGQFILLDCTLTTRFFVSSEQGTGHPMSYSIKGYTLLPTTEPRKIVIFQAVALPTNYGLMLLNLAIILVFIPSTTVMLMHYLTVDE